MRKTTLITLILCLFVLGILTACNDERNEANIGTDINANNANAVLVNNNTTAANTTAVNDNVSVADIMDNTNAYVGKTVIVDGWVEEAYAANAFRLDEDSIFTGGVDNDLLVVGANGVIPAGLKYGDADAKARVTGTVKKMVIADIERDYNIDLKNEVEAEFKDKPVLIANSVRTIED